MMPDREKIIKGLEYCKEYFNCCNKCPYWDGGTHCTADLAHDALALLKEQEAVNPTWQQGKAYCGSCGRGLPAKKIGVKYCGFCGWAVKWK